MLAFISGGELVVVFLVVLLLFGAKSIPDIAKSIGKGMREFRKVSGDISNEINNHDVREAFNDTAREVNKDPRTGSSKNTTASKQDASGQDASGQDASGQDAGGQDASKQDDNKHREA